ncbi:MAG: protein translocase subunit SecF [Fusobacterium periodonticum]|nr:protein translocase subunit SecF [Fusobacterium periodonticum]
MKVNLHIIRNIKYYLSVSIVLVVLSIVVFFAKGLNYGIDFTGGNLFQLKYNDKKITLTEINENLDKLSEKLPQVNSNSRKVQISEDGTVILRVPELKEEDKKEVLNSLQELGAFNLDKEDKVGASIGDDLKKSAIYSLGIGAILIVLYITLRFEFSFAIGGILSLLHDIIIAVGFIALMGYEVDTPFIAAILTILGYSINDTIVIYDRIRENLKRRHTKNWTLEDCMDESVNQTAIRSLNTSITTLFSVIALLIFGGASLKTFIMTLLIGILAGTYSSIFVATPIVYLLNKRKGNNMEDMFKDDDDENNNGKRVEKILV